MNQTCDRCGPAVRAVYRAARHSELYLCRHCANRHWPVLYAQGRVIDPAFGNSPARADDCILAEG
jgi:Zinc finger, ZZ type